MRAKVTWRSCGSRWRRGIWHRTEMVGVGHGGRNGNPGNWIICKLYRKRHLDSKIWLQSDRDRKPRFTGSAVIYALHWPSSDVLHNGIWSGFFYLYRCPACFTIQILTETAQMGPDTRTERMLYSCVPTHIAAEMLIDIGSSPHDGRSSAIKALATGYIIINKQQPSTSLVRRYESNMNMCPVPWCSESKRLVQNWIPQRRCLSFEFVTCLTLLSGFMYTLLVCLPTAKTTSSTASSATSRWEFTLETRYDLSPPLCPFHIDSDHQTRQINTHVHRVLQSVAMWYLPVIFRTIMSDHDQADVPCRSFFIPSTTIDRCGSTATSLGNGSLIVVSTNFIYYQPENFLSQDLPHVTGASHTASILNSLWIPTTIFSLVALAHHTFRWALGPYSHVMLIRRTGEEIPFINDMSAATTAISGFLLKAETKDEWWSSSFPGCCSGFGPFKMPDSLFLLYFWLSTPCQPVSWRSEFPHGSSRSKVLAYFRLSPF